MRLSRRDVVPVLAIVSAGAMGVLTFGPQRFLSPAESASQARSPLSCERSGSESQGAVDEVRRTAFALLTGQSDVLKELRALPEAGVERSMALRSLFSEKATMLEAADRLEASLRRLAVDAERGGAPETGARLSETADAVTLIGLKIAWSRDLVQRADSDSSRYFEERIRADILQVQRQVIVGTAAFSRIELDRSTAYTLECR